MSTLQTSVQEPTIVDPDWSNYWLYFKEGETPNSMMLHKDFMTLIKSQEIKSVLDVGSSRGRVSREIADNTNAKVVGIDINIPEVNLAKKIEKSRVKLATNPIDYYVMDATDMMFEDKLFESAILIGTLGGVHKKMREDILYETVRVLKPGGLIYIAEQERVYGSPKWDREYKEGLMFTGEVGSNVVYHENGLVKFISYHFEEMGLRSLIERAGIYNIKLRRKLVKSTVKGHILQSLCMWGNVKQAHSYSHRIINPSHEYSDKFRIWYESVLEKTYRWSSNTPITSRFKESDLDHVHSAIDYLQLINTFCTIIPSEINLNKTAEMLYLHDGGEGGPGDLPFSNPKYASHRERYRKREFKFFVKEILPRIENENVRNHAMYLYNSYVANNPFDKETQIGHLIDKMQGATTYIKHFANKHNTKPRKEESRQAIFGLERIAFPYIKLISVLSKPAQIELYKILDIVFTFYRSCGFEKEVNTFKRKYSHKNIFF